LILSILLLFVAACAPISITENSLPPATESSTPETVAEPTPGAEENSDVDIESLMESLAETIPLRGAGSDSGFDGVNIFALNAPVGAPDLWVAHTYGIRPFDPLLNHFVALFGYSAGAWTEVSRLELECPDYVDAAGVAQVEISPEIVWLTVDGGAGAHSGCFALLRWDSAALEIAVESFNSSPGAGEVTDVDGDGQNEVLLNGTEPYIFCYACGVRLYAAQILRWTGDALVAVQLTNLPETEDATLRAINNGAVALAEASLYPDALALIRQALTMAPDDERIYWNAQEIELYAANRLFYAEEGAYPLLGYVFYGDYAAALEEMRPLTPEAIFSLESPLILGTAAEMWIGELSQYLIMFADGALAVQPDLAEAYFLRGWARFLADPNDPAVLTDVAQAAQLAPYDPLIVESNDYLQGMAAAPTPTEPARGIPSPGDGSAETIRFAPGATADLIRADLGAASELVYQLEVAGGQTVYITAPGDVNVQMAASSGQLLSGAQTLGAARFEIPNTDLYTLILQGNRPTDVLIYIPPLRNPAGVLQPAGTERVRFAAGTTSATLERTLQEQIPQGFLLGISAGQRLFVTLEGNADSTLLDPEGRLLTPIRVEGDGRVEYVIPFNGDYTVVLQGSGPVTLTTEIPPR
jgi:tetratricopeptide (TPR) repeat protein